MTTAMTTACVTGIVRAAGILLSVIPGAECIYSFLFAGKPEAGDSNRYNPSRSKPLFSEASYSATENNVCNPYRFKNETKLIAQALGFIFFIQPRADRFALDVCKNHSSSGNYFSNSENNYSSIYTENHHSSTLRRNDVTRNLFANRTMQNPTTCL